MEDTIIVEASAGHIPAGPYTVQITNIDKTMHEKYGLNYNVEFTILDKKRALNEIGEEFDLRGRKLSKFFSNTVTTKSLLGKVFLAAGLEVKIGVALRLKDLLDRQIGIVVEDKLGEGKHIGKTFSNPTTFYPAEKKLPALNKSETESAVIEKTTSAAVPATAPDAEADSFVNDLEKEIASKAVDQADEPADTPTEESPEDLEVKLVEAKLKAAKAKAAAAKK